MAKAALHRDDTTARLDAAVAALRKFRSAVSATARQSMGLMTTSFAWSDVAARVGAILEDDSITADTYYDEEDDS